MASLNKVILMGNLTRDPNLKQVNSGTSVCDFGIAVNRRYRSQAGELMEEACFIEVTVWGKQAESTSKYMKKGNLILLEGRLRFEQWQDQEGKNRSRLSVVAENITFMPKEVNKVNDKNNFSSPQNNDNNYSAPQGKNNDVNFDNDVYTEDPESDVPF